MDTNEHEWKLRGEAVAGVAQIFNLPYRRIAFGKALKGFEGARIAKASQIPNLRYGRVQLCATSPGPAFDSCLFVFIRG
jgi:hypothetical protein